MFSSLEAAGVVTAGPNGRDFIRVHVAVACLNERLLRVVDSVAVAVFGCGGPFAKREEGSDQYEESPVESARYEVHETFPSLDRPLRSTSSWVAATMSGTLKRGRFGFILPLLDSREQESWLQGFSSVENGWI